VFYANLKFQQANDLKVDIKILQSKVISLESENKVLQNTIHKLNTEMLKLGLQEEKQTEMLMRDYIISHYRRTPKTVADEISKTILEASKEKKIAAPLILGIIEVESNFDPYAVSKVGARGLMQVMPEWVGKLPTNLSDKFDLHDIKSGIFAGSDVLNIHLSENEGNVNKGLYYYVNKDNSYVLKVYTAVGKFLAFTKDNL
jgi:membrane-bound lytic murein transglycosylase MltF